LRSRAARTAAATVFAFFASSAFAADWKNAGPGWHYEFPRDHHAHPEFKTEWWYFTGNIFDEEGHRFGYELTFFRQGIRPPAERDPTASRFVVGELKFAHFALTDVSRKKFQFEQKTSRGAFGEAGFDDGNRIAWIDNWTLSSDGGDAFDLVGSGEGASMHLHLRATKPPVIHGQNGVSVKAAGGASASHYYSSPRLETTGEISVNGVARPFRGESWFDHEWSSSQLAKGEVGWDWVSLQWKDGAELMLYQMRLATGESEPSSSGTWVAPDGAVTHLERADFTMTPIAFWKSSSGGRYPVAWRITLPRLQTEFTLQAVIEDQELKLGPITYWEGAIDAKGQRGGQPITGHGYLELTGYAGRFTDALNGGRQ